MKTTTHKCDRCGREGPADDLPLYSVTVQVEGSYQPDTVLSAEWCVDCVSSKIAGWVTGVRPAPPDPKPTPTIDDVLREFVQEVIDETVGARQDGE